MSTPVVFPDAELWVCGYLQTTLPTYGYSGVFVSNRRENQPTAVWVRRDGGAALDQVREGPRLGVNVFAPTEQQATDLARTVAALLVAAPDGDPVCRVTQTSGPAGVADEGRAARRYMTFDLVVRGSELLPVGD